MYILTIYDAIALLLLLVDGLSRGVMEALHADRKVLQKKFNLKPTDWGGSEDWMRNYKNNIYKNEDGTINKHKTEILGNFGRDAHHTFGDIIKFCSRLAILIMYLGCDSINLIFVIKVVVLWILSSVTEKFTYDYLRKQK